MIKEIKSKSASDDADKLFFFFLLSET